MNKTFKKDKFTEKSKVCEDLHSKREVGLLELLGIWGLAIASCLLNAFTKIIDMPEAFVNLTSILFFGFQVLGCIGIIKVIWKGIKEEYLDFD